jgi:hypothetical protein
LHCDTGAGLSLGDIEYVCAELAHDFLLYDVYGDAENIYQSNHIPPLADQYTLPDI